MNLETKITIYKFTPQLFTLTQEGQIKILIYPPPAVLVKLSAMEIFIDQCQHPFRIIF